MDLWYYFLHRGLDLLRPGGILSFIVSSYWVSSRSARRLIARLDRETRFQEIVLFDNAPVFPGVAGRHMIFQLQKTVQTKASRAAESRITLASADTDSRGGVNDAPVAKAGNYRVAHSELFRNGRLIVTRPDPIERVFHGRPGLGEFFDTRQGMAENPPRVNRRLHRQLAGRVPSQPTAGGKAWTSRSCIGTPHRR